MYNNAIGKGSNKMKKFIYILLMILLVSCSTKTPINKPVEIEKTPDLAGTANAISYWATKTAQPTNTIFPTRIPTKDTRTASEKAVDRCLNSGTGVRYVIEASWVSEVSITLTNDTNGTEQGDYVVPYCRTFSNFSSGDFLYLSAQIILPTTGAGSITCKIYDGSKVISQGTASGFPSIATCSTNKP